jgi:hypothetical protein
MTSDGERRTSQAADPWNIKPQGAYINVAKLSSLKSSDYYMEPSSVGDPDPGSRSSSGDVYLPSTCFQNDVLYQFFEYLSRIRFKPDRIPNTGTKYPLKSKLHMPSRECLLTIEIGWFHPRRDGKREVDGERGDYRDDRYSLSNSTGVMESHPSSTSNYCLLSKMRRSSSST